MQHFRLIESLSHNPATELSHDYLHYGLTSNQHPHAGCPLINMWPPSLGELWGKWRLYRSGLGMLKFFDHRSLLYLALMAGPLHSALRPGSRDLSINPHL
ncbi:hypothetical protein FVER53590_30362 [Fusarium verticillioides]|nr:hypothetical protein FVER53590_30362 [Fusarium verticillioides]